MPYSNEQDLPSDGRSLYEWESKYSTDAKKMMIIEAIYLVMIFFISILAIFFTYTGKVAEVLSIEDLRKISFNRIVYCISSGMLGGATFNIKIFYRAIARGQWHEDRAYWRWMAPLMSLSVSILVAAFMCHDVISKAPYFAVSVGYFAGYFSEHAMGKMYDIATVLFGSPKGSNRDDDAKIKKPKASNSKGVYGENEVIDHKKENVVSS